MSTDKGERSSNFIRTIIEEDRSAGKYNGQVVTRFPPEPNGHLHIGHAKSICLNFGLAQDYQGTCHLRMDDTNPTKEDVAYVEAIKRDIKWLGFDWGDKMFYASDYYEELYEHAVKLIKKGLAYVCSLDEETLRAYRGTLTEPGTPSPYRKRSVEENLDLFARMRAGEFKEGEHILRANIDMGASNMKMRDPILYRILHSHHYRQGDAWHIYPMYDYAHPLSDAMEGITHSVCTLEFENNRDLYDWVVASSEMEWVPKQYEFARLNIDYTVMSKRYLLKLVTEGIVDGWDDPRMPTIAGMRRRGYRPEAIRAFCEMIGVAKNNSMVDIGKLEYCVRDDLNHNAPRAMVVLDPLKVTLTNLPEEEAKTLTCDLWPHDIPKEGTREVPLTRELYIERADFEETPPKGFRRLVPGGEVRLRHAWIIRCDEVIKDEAGEVIELRCSIDKETLNKNPADGRKIKGTIHWVSATKGLEAEVRLYDRLFKAKVPGSHGRSYEDDMNPESLKVIRAVIEPYLATAKAGERFQFERQGYFSADSVDWSSDKPVFNRIVTLRDSWSKREEEAAPAPVNNTPAEKSAKAKTRPQRRSQAEIREQIREENPELASRYASYQEKLGLDAKDADVLTGDLALATFFEEALTAFDDATTVAKWVTNEVLREIKDENLADLPIKGASLGKLASLVASDKINATAGKEVFAEMVKTGQEPEAIIKAKGLEQVSDSGSLEPVIDNILANHSDEVQRFRDGNKGLMGFFIGQIMRATGGKANPKMVQSLLRSKLS